MSIWLHLRKVHLKLEKTYCHFSLYSLNFLWKHQQEHNLQPDCVSGTFTYVCCENFTSTVFELAQYRVFEIAKPVTCSYEALVHKEALTICQDRTICLCIIFMFSINILSFRRILTAAVLWYQLTGEGEVLPHGE